MTSHTVVVFAKAPLPGKVKTRLAASIGAEQAAAFAEAFIDDTCDTVARLDARGVVAYAGDPEHPAFVRARGLGMQLRPQPDGDLGTRLETVLRAEAANADTVTAIGADSPTMLPSHFEQSWSALQTHDVVIGPSFDGGYYLLGLTAKILLSQSAPHPIFDGIDWSTGAVLGQTLRRCRAIGALCELIGFCYDVDTLQDLQLLQTHLLEHLRPSGLDVAHNTAILLSKTPSD